MSLAEYFRGCHQQVIDDRQKVLCLRHDVDIINPVATKTFFDVELSLGVKATYYIRFYTAGANRKLLEALHDNGFEVGYHYEEIATFVKEHKLRSRKAIYENMERIRARFMENCHVFRERYAQNMTSICGHGDWANVRFSLYNPELITQQMLDGLDLDFEAYQPQLMSLFDVYVSDVANYPQRWKETSAHDALRDNLKRIYMLTHERFWFTSPFRNSVANFKTLREQVQYRFF